MTPDTRDPRAIMRNAILWSLAAAAVLWGAIFALWWAVVR